METPGLEHHEILHHAHSQHQSLHDQHLKSMNEQKRVSLRSMSKSDPHLNIPHLMVSQDEEHPSLNRIVSGVFQVNNALRTPLSDSGFKRDDSLMAPNGFLKTSERHLNRRVSMEGLPAGNGDFGLLPPLHHSTSAALLREGGPAQITTLRKSTSAIDWNGAVAEARKLKPEFPNYDNYFLEPIGSNRSLAGTESAGEPYTHIGGGLVMSSSPNNHNNMSVVASQIHPHFAQGLGSAAAAAASHQAGMNPLDGTRHDVQDRKGMFGNMFRQGFFSRPVVRSEEENYRYLMALDR